MLALAERLQLHAISLFLKMMACVSRQLAHVAEKAFLEFELHIWVVLLETGLFVYFVADSLLIVLLYVVREVGLRFVELDLSANFPQKLTRQVYALLIR